MSKVAIASQIAIEIETQPGSRFNARVHTLSAAAAGIAGAGIGLGSEAMGL
jgi:hypothetical protein